MEVFVFVMMILKSSGPRYYDTLTDLVVAFLSVLAGGVRPARRHLRAGPTTAASTDD